MKRKILAVVVACATLFLGMGYAYWTDSLQIDTKATTGELKVKFIDLALYGQYHSPDDEDGWIVVDGIGDPGYVADYFFERGANYNIPADPAALEAYNDRIWGYTHTSFGAILKNPKDLGVQIDGYGPETDASNTIKIDLTKIYPGFGIVYQSDIVNAGTIAAKLADIKLTLTGQEEDVLYDMIGVSMEVLREYAGDPSEGHVPVFHTNDLLPADTFELAGVEFIRLSALANLLDGDDDLINETIYVLPDNSRMDLYLGIAMDPDKAGRFTTGWTGELKDNNDADTELESTSFQVQFLWDQFNLDVPEDGDNNHLGDGDGDGGAE